MTGLAFERPVLAVCLLLALAFALVLARKLGRRFVAAVPLGAPGGVPFKPPFNLDKLIRLFRLLEWAGILLLAMAAAGPEYRKSEKVWLGRGADVMFILDVSPSMAAQDMGGNRFELARGLLLDFAERRPADGIGVIGVGSDAALLLPPTVDRELLATRLAALELGELGDGSALGTALAMAAFHIGRSEAPRRVVILLSDGENNAGSIHPETAAAMIREVAASLWVVGIGSGGIVPIDYTDPFTRIRQSGMYDSGFDAEALKRLAEAGGGSWLHAPSAAAFAAAFADIDRQELTVLRSGTATTVRPLHRPFLILALALLAGTRLLKRLFLGAWL
ncbi:MAG: VWA domain-containing protein [Treponema sp.]|nr:VWA domain-containing protein [Treponema sp.]